MSQVTPDFIVEHCKRHKLPIPRNMRPEAKKTANESYSNVIWNNQNEH